MTLHIITIDEEQRREVARALDTKIKRTLARLRWQDRLLQRGGVHSDGSPCDLEKERSIYAKREQRVARLREIIKIFDEHDTQD